MPGSAYQYHLPANTGEPYWAEVAPWNGTQAELSACKRIKKEKGSQFPVCIKKKPPMFGGENERSVSWSKEAWIGGLGSVLLRGKWSYEPPYCHTAGVLCAPGRCHYTRSG